MNLRKYGHIIIVIFVVSVVLGGLGLTMTGKIAGNNNIYTEVDRLADGTGADDTHIRQIADFWSSNLTFWGSTIPLICIPGLILLFIGITGILRWFKPPKK